METRYKKGIRALQGMRQVAFGKRRGFISITFITTVGGAKPSKILGTYQTTGYNVKFSLS